MCKISAAIQFTGRPIPLKSPVHDHEPSFSQDRSRFVLQRWWEDAFKVTSSDATLIFVVASRAILCMFDRDACEHGMKAVWYWWLAMEANGRPRLGSHPSTPRESHLSFAHSPIPCTST